MASEKEISREEAYFMTGQVLPENAKVKVVKLETKDDIIEAWHIFPDELKDEIRKNALEREEYDFLAKLPKE